MDEAPLILLAFGVAVFVVIVAPILALVSWTRVRALERRVDELVRRGVPQPAQAPAPAAVRPTPPQVTVTLPEPVVAPPPVVVPPSIPVPPPAPVVSPASVPLAADAATPAGSAPIFASKASPSKSGLDLERMIAGRWLNRIGLLAVAVGIAFFLKAAIDNDWIGPGGQVAIGLLLGAGLIASATMFVKRGYLFFADGLIGLGGAVLYLSLWAASGYYHLIAPAVAFGAMVIVTAALLGIALGRNSRRVASLALLGGFITPLLVSTGQDSHVVLFSYLALQDAVLLVLADRRDWRLLELPAFLFTEIYFFAWFSSFYRDPMLLETSLFATLFFVIFTAIPVIRSRRQGAFRIEHGLVMLANVALFLIALQVMMWPEHRWVLTASTLALAVFHLIVVRAVPANQTLPRLLIGGLALTLVTLAIPLRLSVRWTTMAWSIEAAILMWTGFRVKIWQVRTASFILFMIVGLMLLMWPPDYEMALWNARFGGTLAAVACAFAALWFARGNQREVQQGEQPAFGALGIAANVLLVLGVTEEITLAYRLRLTASPDLIPTHVAGLQVSLFWTLYASLLVALGVRMKSAFLRWQGLALFGLTTLKVFFVDLSDLSGFYRILSAIALGIVLLIVSFVYQRKLAADQQEESA
jgi:uncharacterized membrane protein